MPPESTTSRWWRASVSQWTHLTRPSNRKRAQAPSIPLGIPYLYTPLPRGSIRLLTIHTQKRRPLSYSLDTYTQDVAPDYDAVSYCWGDDPASTTIKCDEADLCIRKSLFTALPYLADRPASHRPLWIDAICLNQEDADEKAVQVSMMHNIYKHAARTIVWLGEPDEDTDVALAFISEVTSFLQKDGNPHLIDKYQRETEWRALREYLSRPWFFRLWVYQEVVLSQKVDILCHSRSTTMISWQSLNGFLTILIGKSELSTSLMDRSHRSALWDVAALEARRQAVIEDGSASFSALLWSCGPRWCREPVDRIWALIGPLPPSFVARIQQAKLIDYSESAKREYWQSYLAFMKLLHQDNALDFRQTLFREVVSPKHPSLPSWCPDFNSGHPYRSFVELRNFRAGFVNEERLVQSTTELSPTCDALLMLGFEVSKVRGVTSSAPEETSLVDPEIDLGWLLWHQQCEKLTLQALGESEEVASDMGQTLLAPDHEEKKRFPHPWDQYYRCLRVKRYSTPSYLFTCPHDEEERHREYAGDTQALCCRRTFFITNDGRSGLGPAGLRVGDKICVFVGEGPLYVLRDTRHQIPHADDGQRAKQEVHLEPFQETFFLIGEAYVRGLMFGEAFMADGRGSERKFAIV